MNNCSYISSKNAVCQVKNKKAVAKVSDLFDSLSFDLFYRLSILLICAYICCGFKVFSRGVAGERKLVRRFAARTVVFRLFTVSFFIYAHRNRFAACRYDGNGFACGGQDKIVVEP